MVRSAAARSGLSTSFVIRVAPVGTTVTGRQARIVRWECHQEMAAGSYSTLALDQRWRSRDG
jgi:hypothetical protein